MNDSKRLNALWLAVLICFSVVSQLSAAHPFHISIAEMEWNPETRRIEVSLKLQSLDTEQSLSKTAKRKVNIEKEAEPAELLEKFVADHFYLVPAEQVDTEDSPRPKLAEDAIRSKVHFVGHELDVTWLWLYFELELEDAAIEKVKAEGDWVLMNTVLLEITDGQINTVSVRRDGKKVSQRTTIKQPWVAIKNSALGIE